MKGTISYTRTRIAKGYLQMLAILMLLPTITIYAQFPKLPDGWSDAYAYTNGIRMHYYHAKPAPGKPVMVMMHGFTDIGLSWTTLTLKLEDAYDIYMIDARGHGFTDPPTPTDAGDAMVKDLVGFVQW
ncbi:MAG: alpha/beta fold hydrolase, partial [Ferruginibacter sp.]